MNIVARSMNDLCRHMAHKLMEKVCRESRVSMRCEPITKSLSRITLRSHRQPHAWVAVRGAVATLQLSLASSCSFPPSFVLLSTGKVSLALELSLPLSRPARTVFLLVQFSYLFFQRVPDEEEPASPSLPKDV